MGREDSPPAPIFTSTPLAGPSSGRQTGRNEPRLGGPDEDSIGDGPVRAGSELYCGVNGVVWASGARARRLPAELRGIAPYPAALASYRELCLCWPGRPRADRGQRAGRECCPVLSGLIQRRPLCGSASDPPGARQACGGDLLRLGPSVPALRAAAGRPSGHLPADGVCR